ADLSGSSSIGGLVGSNYEGTVKNSYATGNVSGEEHVGGFVGITVHGTVSNSYATGEVSGEEHVGGFVGRNLASRVENSYSVGKVTGEENVSGLVGDNYENLGDIENSFWNVETSGQNESDGGTGKTTGEMKDVATFTDFSTEGLNEPWDFVGDPNDDEGDEDIWDIDEDEELNDGYPFLSWEIRNELRIKIEGNGTVEVDGKEVEDGWTELYDDGTKVDITAIPDEGHEFHGWIGDHTGDEKNITITIDSDKVIIAYFEEEVPEYDLTIDIEGKGSTEPSEGTHTYEEGTVVTINATATEGWKFIEWIGDHTGFERNITVTMDSDKNITAVFEELSYYTLTVNVEGEGTTDPEEGTHSYEEGEVVTVEATPADGWQFVEWTDDETGTESTLEITMDENKSITAVFEEEVEYYELTVNVKGDGSTDPEEGTHSYEEGEVVTVEATPAEDWIFVEWIGDETGTETTIEVTMDENKSITAVFEEEVEHYELTVNVKGEGGTEPEEGNHTYEEGTVVTVEATPAEGWHFVEWTGDKTSTEPTIEVTMDADKVITANFEEVVEYDLKIATEGNGAVEVDGERVESDWTATYEEGTEVELKAIPDEGYVFKEWTGSHEDEDVEITVVMDENKTITAHFEEEPAPEIAVTNFNVDVDGLEITITADIENDGNAEGTIDLIVEGEVVDSFTIGPGDVDTVEKTHRFEEEGEYSVELGDESETVTVGEEKEDIDDGIGMTTVIGIVVIIVVLLVIVIGYIMKGGGGTDTAAEEEYGEEETEENMFRENTYSDL
ncbi:MAG: InlB B-repeat-containing protein, partial [Candidatus Aenigmatarchaeota archaeon]